MENALELFVTPIQDFPSSTSAGKPSRFAKVCRKSKSFDRRDEEDGGDFHGQDYVIHPHVDRKEANEKRGETLPTGKEWEPWSRRLAAPIIDEIVS